MKRYSVFVAYSVILIRLLSACWFYLHGSSLTNLDGWNIEFMGLMIASSIITVILFKKDDRVLTYILLVLDCFIVILSLFPIRGHSFIFLALYFSFFWLITYFLNSKPRVIFFIGSVILIQLFSGDNLIAGVFISGLKLGGKIELLISQVIIFYILVSLDAIGKDADKLDEKKNIYSKNMSNLLEKNLDMQNYILKDRVIVRQDERKRIAGELHDSVMHSLLNLKMSVESMRDNVDMDNKPLIKLLDLSESILNNLWENIEEEIYDIRSFNDSEKIGLSLIYDLVKTFQDATQIEVETEYTNFPMSLGPQIDRIIYRVIQEGLTNAFRHGKATKIIVMLWQEDNCYRFVVRDNGVGGKVDTSSGIGLWGINQRLEAVKGSVSFKTSSLGFEMSAKIPK